MAHEIVPAAEEILDREFSVLDHGFVRLVDYMGGDARIVQAARVSYGEGTRTYREDRGLINYLLRNEHTSPFEQVVLTFHAKMPIFVARQWVRHRTARLNEISGRYSVLKAEFYVPQGDHVSPQSDNNKQGRSADPFPADVRERIITSLREGQARAHGEYDALLAGGVARELARINLPLSTYTEWYWQIDLHNLFHFLHLRMDIHAQYEIRVYAETMFEIARAVAPVACEAFAEHRLGSVRFSQREFALLQRALDRGVSTDEELEALALDAEFTKREARRFVEKVRTGKMG